MFFILLFIFVNLRKIDGSEVLLQRKCFAPVVCSFDHGSSPDWQQVFPPPSCQMADTQCPSTESMQCPINISVVNSIIQKEITEHTKSVHVDQNTTLKRLEELESQLNESKEESKNQKQRILLSPVLGSWQNPAKDCKEIKNNETTASSGIYYMMDNENNIFSTYCDMITGGGGWTLVGSVHENNMKGKCTSGDRWSSEQGNSADHPHGDGFWGNRATHGIASSATSDDYKNPAYFNMNATDLMIWQVPNDTPVSQFEDRAYLKYHTETGFLTSYGGNLQSLFSEHYPMLDKTYQTYTDNGPAIPVIWDRGSNEQMVNFTPVNMRSRVDPGYIQFRAINYERSAFALCHGVRIKEGQGDAEHVCIGSTSNNIGHIDEELYGGDFAAKDWPGDGVNSSDIIIQSVIMMFYR